ncbi:uncharacterized protein [Amphiura filiformis]|uniref:uncharacterized protein n=1 Tax=Amphiura filiformis TaxID=82378 RepID=UPI003B219E41
MEEQLAAYRARKAKEQAHQNSGKSSWFGSKSVPQPNMQNDEMLRGEDTGAVISSSSEPGSESSRQDCGYLRIPASITNSRLANFIRKDTSLLTNTLFLKIILWVALLVFFVIIEFAAVYIVFTLFYVMYANMRSGRETKRPGELSAYSVFNPNCERIDGTLTAEQFEKELRHGIGST